MSRPEEVLDRFFAAIQRGDMDTVADLYAPDVRVWHSVTGVDVDRAASLAILGWLTVPGVVLRYEILERLVAGTRVSQRHVLEVDVAGRTVVVPASIWFTIEGGLISRIDEYTDAALTEELIRLVPRR